jgi:hypothetical protein
MEPPTSDRDPVLLPLLFIAPAVAFIVTLPILFGWALAAALVALAGAAGIGAPVLALARRVGLRGWVPTVLLGLVTGAAPVGLWPLLARWWSGAAAGGLVNWRVALLAGLVGGASGGVYSIIHDTIDLPPPLARRRVVGTVFLAVALAFASLFWRP